MSHGPRMWLAMFVAVVEKEVRQTVRDKRMVAVLVIVPVLQLFIFGHAVSLEVDAVPTVVVDLDRTATSREHVQRLLADGTLALLAHDESVEEAERRLVTGEAAVLLVIPEGFERDVVRARPANVQAIVDGSNGNQSGVATSAIATYFAGVSRGILVERAERRAASLGIAASVPDAPVRSRVLFNPELETSIYMVPGVAAMLLMIITTIVTAMGLARERERGTLEQILVTPVPSAVLIAGKILPFAIVGLLDLGIAMVVGAFVFEMPLRGDLSVLFLATILYLATTLGIGLLISTLSGSQQQAFMGGFLFMLPAALLSGIMTPVASMPAWLQPLTLLNPLRHYQEVLRGVLLRGAGLVELDRQVLALGLMGALVFTLAALRFRSSTR